MGKRWAALVAALVVSMVTGGIVLAASYDGEDTCRDVKAWPGGSYLGQMHPFHVAFYTDYANTAGFERCQFWALEQRYSAVRGLRELGYTIFGPGQFAWPPPAPELPPLTELPPDSLSYRETSGRGSAWATMDLVRGIHTISYRYDQWHSGPVRIQMVGPAGAMSTIHDGSLNSRGILMVPIPQAGTYTFHVEAEGNWQLETGERPRVVEREAPLTVQACEAFLFG